MANNIKECNSKSYMLDMFLKDEIYLEFWVFDNKDEFEKGFAFANLVYCRKMNVNEIKPYLNGLQDGYKATGKNPFIVVLDENDVIITTNEK